VPGGVDGWALASAPPPPFASKAAPSDQEGGAGEAGRRGTFQRERAWKAQRRGLGLRGRTGGARRRQRLGIAQHSMAPAHSTHTCYATLCHATMVSALAL
jgi:hypothetical protein